MRVGPQWDAESACQSKVGKFEVSSLVNEKVLRLEVAMEDSVSVAVVDAAHELESEFLRAIDVRQDGDKEGEWI